MMVYDAVKVDPLQVDKDGRMSITSSCNKLMDWATYELAHQRIKAVREAVGGKIDVIVELHCGTSVISGTQMARMCEEYGCMFVEETRSLHESALMKKVSRSVTSPWRRENGFTRAGGTDNTWKISL